MSGLPALPLLQKVVNSRDYKIFLVFKQAFDQKWNTEQFTQALQPFLLVDDNDIAIPFIEGICDYRLKPEMREYALSLLPYLSKTELLITASKYIPIPLDYLDSLISGNTNWNDLIGKVEPEYLKHILAKKQVFAEYPSWITTKKYEGEIQKIDFDAEEVLNQLKEKIDVYDKDADIDEIDIKNIGAAVMSMIVDDPSKVQIYGPVNGKKTCENEEDCYMFNCNCCDENEFEKVCEGCGLAIRNKRHCLRMPLEGHGWMGWYHSYECLIDNCPEPTLAEVANLKMLKSVIDTYGILQLKK